MRDKIIENINKIKAKKEGFDLIIIVSSNNNAKYWNWRLSETRKEILPQKTKIICVKENWKNKEGAGQFLGTLNALKEANKKINLLKLLKEKKKIAVYHTAGKGKRMAPLCGTENNNKPAIKLPKPIKVNKKNNLFSILEAVIYSTQIFAKNREGRICVFWGDQIILPSNNITPSLNSPIEILGIKYKIKFSKEEWEKNNWQNYGILIPSENTFLHREKISFENLKEIKRNGLIKEKGGKIEVLKSLGCFSLSFQFLEKLLLEFEKELKEKKEKLDVEPALWEALTSDEKEYVKRNKNKNHFQRVKKLKEEFEKTTKTKLVIIATDLGKNTIYWDYGNLSAYFKNILKTREKSKEGEIAREFFGIKKYFKGGNIIINSKIGGDIKNCVILNSKIEKANIKDSVIINSQIKEIKNGKNNLLYYLREKNQISLLAEEVITDIKIKKGEIIRMKTKISRDGKEDWKIKLPGNPFSYSELEKIVSKIKI